MKKERIPGYDAIRVVAAAMVIAIHSNVFYLLPFDGSISWFIVMELTALCVVAVPLFFMVSGAVNIGTDKTFSIKELLVRKIPKLFIPFFLWSCIYVIARMVTGKLDISLYNFISLLWEPAYYQFWFIYSLLGMYICLPIFHTILHKTSKITAQYIIFLWSIFSVIIPILLRYIPELRLSKHFDMILLEGYWGYFFIGGYLHKYPIKNAHKWGKLLFSIGITITAICSLLEYYYEDSYYGYVYSAYLLPGAIISSIGLFLLFSKIKTEGYFKSIITHLALLSMGVYYIHTLIISALEPFIFNIWGHAWYFAIFKWIIICVLSIIGVEIIKRIPILSKYLL